jgi:hypothetical protein
VFQVSFVLLADKLCSATFIEYLLKYKNMGCRGEGNINALVLPTVKSVGWIHMKFSSATVVGAVFL